SLPRQYRLNVLRSKRLQKWYAERILPASILKRKKRGFLSPTSSWFKAGAVRDILMRRNSALSSYLDQREVDLVLKDHVAGKNRERHIFLLLSLHYWMSEYLAPKTPPYGYALAV